MTETDRQPFAALLADVLGFYGQPVTPFAMGVWWQACLPFDLDAVRLAMTRHATDPDHGHFAPKPADVIRQLRGNSAEAAITAWSTVLDQVRSVGSYGSPKFDDATRSAVQSLGGWGAICRAQETELPFLQKRFADAYQAHSNELSRAALSIADSNVLRMIGSDA